MKGNIKGVGAVLIVTSILISLGYWWGINDVSEPMLVYIEPEVKIVEKSVYTEREKCNKLGGYFSAVDIDDSFEKSEYHTKNGTTIQFESASNTPNLGKKKFIVECKIPSKVIPL